MLCRYTKMMLCSFNSVRFPFHGHKFQIFQNLVSLQMLIRVHKLVPGPRAIPFLPINDFLHSMRLKQFLRRQHRAVLPDQKHPPVCPLTTPGYRPDIKDSLFDPLPQHRRFHIKISLQFPVRIPTVIILTQIRRNLFPLNGPLADPAFQSVLIKPGILPRSSATADRTGIPFLIKVKSTRRFLQLLLPSLILQKATDRHFSHSLHKILHI